MSLLKVKVCGSCTTDIDFKLSEYEHVTFSCFHILSILQMQNILRTLSLALCKLITFKFVS